MDFTRNNVNVDLLGEHIAQSLRNGYRRQAGALKPYVYQSCGTSLPQYRTQ